MAPHRTTRPARSGGSRSHCRALASTLTPALAHSRHSGRPPHASATLSSIGVWVFGAMSTRPCGTPVASCNPLRSSSSTDARRGRGTPGVPTPLSPNDRTLTLAPTLTLTLPPNDRRCSPSERWWRFEARGYPKLGATGQRRLGRRDAWRLRASEGRHGCGVSG